MHCECYPNQLVSVPLASSTASSNFVLQTGATTALGSTNAGFTDSLGHRRRRSGGSERYDRKPQPRKSNGTFGKRSPSKGAKVSKSRRPPVAAKVSKPPYSRRPAAVAETATVVETAAPPLPVSSRPAFPPQSAMSLLNSLMKPSSTTTEEAEPLVALSPRTPLSMGGITS